MRILSLLTWVVVIGPPAILASGLARDWTPDFDNPARAACVHHRVQVALDPQTAQLEGTDELTLVHPAGVPGSVATPFLLNRALMIDGISAIPDIGLRSAERDRWDPRDFWDRPEYSDLDGMDHARQIDLFMGGAKPAVWPETLRVTVRFHGIVHDSLRSPSAAYQRGFETTTGLIDPRGAYLAGSTLFHPLRPGERFRFNLLSRLPDDWQTISQGERELPDDDPETGHLIGWSCSQPMEEMYLIAGPYILRERDHGRIRIQTFTYGRDDDSLCADYMSHTAAYLDLYSELIGPYPFSKFAIVENFWQTGYGMPSFTLLGDRVIRLPFIVHTSLGHEILHNWWGNGVFVDATRGNWCEGLTAYGADYLYKERESAAAARDYRRTVLQDYLDYVRGGRDFPLSEFRSRHDASSQAIGYGKSMMLYHMIRRRLGDEAFWRALGEFYRRHLFEAGEWDDVLAAFAAQPGGERLRFDRFREEWIARANAPAIGLESAEVRSAPDGVDLDIALSQTLPAYALDVPLRAVLADGRAFSMMMLLEQERAETTWRLPGPVRSLAVDPDFELFRRLDRQEIPIALSGVMGADSIVAIAAGEGPSADRDAYQTLLREWRPRAETPLLDASSVSPARLPSASIWLFDEAPWLRDLSPGLPDELSIEPKQFILGGRSYDRGKFTLAAALSHPAGGDLSMGLLLAPSPQAALEAGRKLTHYGRYGYLVFEGATNVAKGSWTPGRSPLLKVWDRN